MNIITLGVCPANPVRVFDDTPTLIPTLFARLHREIASCDRIDELVDAAMQMMPGAWDLSAFAHERLVTAADRRFAEIRAQECAA